MEEFEFEDFFFIKKLFPSIELQSTQRNWVIATNSIILITLSLQPDGITFDTFKL